MLLASLILAMGLLVRGNLTGWWAKYMGVALWSSLVYALVLVLAPRLRVRVVFTLCLAMSVAVELFQLSGIPSRLADVHRGFALVLGTTFHAPDFPAYLVGCFLGAALHVGIARMRGCVN